MDLVAHLILRLISLNTLINIFDSDSKQEEKMSSYIDLDNFQFELYTSFASEEEAVGLELINLLEQLCNKFNK